MTHQAQFQQIESRGNNDYIAEASTLGLKPGEWPEQIVITSTTQPAMLFRKSAPVVIDDELLYVGYRGVAANGMDNIYLSVFND